MFDFFKKLSFKQKNLLLLSASVLFLVVAYFVAVSKTVALYRRNTNKEKRHKS